MDYLTEQHIVSLLENLKNANARLKEVYQLEPTPVHQDAAIKRPLVDQLIASAERILTPSP